jgi:hypothetical protein
VKKSARGFGAEWNMNSRYNFAAGAVLCFESNISSLFSYGVVATVSSNFSDIIVIEPAVFFRWYFLSMEKLSLFAQPEAGVYLILEDSDFTPMFLGGLRAGIRIPLGEDFFIVGCH